MGFGYSFRDGDWPRLRQIIQKLSSLNLGPESTPTFTGLTITGDLDVTGTGTFGSLVIDDDGTIGSVSDPDSITIDSTGNVAMSQKLTVTGISRFDGGVGIGTDPTTAFPIFVYTTAREGGFTARIQNTTTHVSAFAQSRVESDTGSVVMIAHSTISTIDRWDFGDKLAGKFEFVTVDGPLIVGTISTDDLILGTNSLKAITIAGADQEVTLAEGLNVGGGLDVGEDATITGTLTADATITGTLTANATITGTLTASSTVNFTGNSINLGDGGGTIQINEVYFLPPARGTTNFLVTQTATEDTWGYVDEGTLDVATADAVAVVDAGDTDATFYLGLWNAVSGDLEGKTDGALTFNAATNALTLGGDVAMLGNLSVGTTATPGVNTHTLRVNQGADNQGFWLYGFDDRDTSFLRFFIRNTGETGIIASGTLITTAISGAIGFTAAGDISFNSGDDITMDLGGKTASQVFAVRDSDNAVLWSIDGAGNMRLVSGNLDIESGNITVTGTGNFSAVNIGDGTNETQISATGDITFVGGAGLPFGEAHQADGATFDVTMTTVNAWTEVDAATTNISATELNLVTFPGDHYLQVEKAGKYLVTYSFTADIDSVAGGEQHIESGIMVNDAIQANRGLGHEQYAATNKERNLQGHTIVDVPTNGQISLAIKNTTAGGRTLTIDHFNITVTQLGGT